MYDDFPELGTPCTDPVIELAVLREALRLLVKTEQLSSDDETLIATQTRNVLRYGRRHAPDEAPAEAPSVRVPFDLDAETLREPTPDYAPISFPNGEEEPEGFTIPMRLAQLGYQCTPSEAGVYGSAMIRLARDEWRRQFAGEPVHQEGADWYGIEDARWVDPLIHATMAKWRTITQTTGEGA